MIEWAAQDTAIELKAAYQGERDSEVRPRLHGLWLVREGWSLARVAAALGVHYRSVQRWVGWYRAGGLERVRAHKMGGVGQAPFLSAAQEEEVATTVASGRFRGGKEIRRWIEEQFGAHYTLGGLYSLLDRLGCSPKVPRPVHEKTDRVAQEQFKRGASSRRSASRGSERARRSSLPTRCGWACAAPRGGSGDAGA